MMETMIGIGPGTGFGPGSANTGGCVFESSLGQNAFGRIASKNIDKAVSAMAFDAATARSEIAGEPIGMYKMRVKKVEYKDKFSGNVVKDLTLISLDFNDEPIAVWTDAGEHGTGTRDEYQRIVSRANQLAQTEGNASLFWVSPGKKTEGVITPHRAYLWVKKGEEVTAYSYSLAGSNDSLSKMMNNLGYHKEIENETLETQTFIQRGEDKQITHTDIFHAFVNSLSNDELERSQPFIQHFKREVDIPDNVREIKLTRYQEQYEKELRETYKNDIKQALESIAAGFIALPKVLDELHRFDPAKNTSDGADIQDHDIGITKTEEVNPNQPVLVSDYSQPDRLGLNNDRVPQSPIDGQTPNDEINPQHIHQGSESPRLPVNPDERLLKDNPSLLETESSSSSVKLNERKGYILVVNPVATEENRIIFSRVLLDSVENPSVKDSPQPGYRNNEEHSIQLDKKLLVPIVVVLPVVLRNLTDRSVLASSDDKLLTSTKKDISNGNEKQDPTVEIYSSAVKVGNPDSSFTSYTSELLENQEFSQLLVSIIFQLLNTDGQAESLVKKHPSTTGSSSPDSSAIADSPELSEEERMPQLIDAILLYLLSIQENEELTTVIPVEETNGNRHLEHSKGERVATVPMLLDNLQLFPDFEQDPETGIYQFLNRFIRIFEEYEEIPSNDDQDRHILKIPRELETEVISIGQQLVDLYIQKSIFQTTGSFTSEKKPIWISSLNRLSSLLSLYQDELTEQKLKQYIVIFIFHEIQTIKYASQTDYYTEDFTQNIDRLSVIVPLLQQRFEYLMEGFGQVLRMENSKDRMFQIKTDDNSMYLLLLLLIVNSTKSATPIHITDKLMRILQKIENTGKKRIQFLRPSKRHNQNSVEILLSRAYVNKIPRIVRKVSNKKRNTQLPKTAVIFCYLNIGNDRLISY